MCRLIRTPWASAALDWKMSRILLTLPRTNQDEYCDSYLVGYPSYWFGSRMVDIYVRSKLRRQIEPWSGIQGSRYISKGARLISALLFSHGVSKVSDTNSSANFKYFIFLDVLLTDAHPSETELVSKRSHCRHQIRILSFKRVLREA